jgi:hypothetical protein
MKKLEYNNDRRLINGVATEIRLKIAKESIEYVRKRK